MDTYPHAVLGRPLAPSSTLSFDNSNTYSNSNSNELYLRRLVDALVHNTFAHVRAFGFRLLTSLIAIADTLLYTEMQVVQQSDNVVQQSDNVLVGGHSIRAVAELLLRGCLDTDHMVYTVHILSPSHNA